MIDAVTKNDAGVAAATPASFFVRFNGGIGLYGGDRAI